jgi:hypothetical protein
MLYLIVFPLITIFPLLFLKDFSRFVQKLSAAYIVRPRNKFEGKNNEKKEKTACKEKEQHLAVSHQDDNAHRDDLNAHRADVILKLQGAKKCA